MKRSILTVAAILCLPVGALAQQPVEVAESVVRDVALTLNLVGTVEPVLSSTVSSEIAGQVEEILVQEGDHLSRDQVIARLDWDMIQVRVVQAKARVQQAAGDLERAKMLVDENLGSVERLQQVQMVLALRTADFDLASLQLASTSIRAPFSGTIAARHVEVGEWVTIGGSVVDLIQIDSVFVMASVPESHIPHLKPGTPARILCDAYPGQSFSGYVHRVIPRGDLNSHAFPIKIKVPNPGHKLKAGMFARVDLEVDRARRLVLVPKDAVVNEAGEKFVYEAEESGHARRVKVQTGRTEGEYVVVEGNLTPEATVVVTGNETLRDGAEIVITRRYTVR